MSFEGSAFMHVNFNGSKQRIKCQKNFYYILVKLHNNKDGEFVTEQRFVK